MTADQLVSDSIIPLRTSDSGDDALGMMSDFFVRHLPIVNNKELLGLLSEDDILDHDAVEPVGSYSLSLPRPYVHAQDHLYEVMRMLVELHLTVIPVVDEENTYLGLITLEDLLFYFGQSMPFIEPGSILVLEMGKRDYMLSEIARIVESENATVLSAFVTSRPDTNLIEVTLKINKQNIQTIIATLDRYDYQIKATFQETTYVDTLRDRYDALMSYLNV
jgi:CBS domain-containing protein